MIPRTHTNEVSQNDVIIPLKDSVMIAVNIGGVTMKWFLRFVEFLRQLYSKPKNGNGISHVFLLFFWPYIDEEADRFFKAIKGLKVRTTWLRLMMNHRLKWSDGNWYGQMFCPYKIYDDRRSGWNELWFETVEKYVKKCNDRKITVGLSLIDMNYAHLGPYPMDWYEGEIRGPMREYFEKVLGKLGTWKNGVYFPKCKFILEPTNEQHSSGMPTVEWMENAVKLLKELTSDKIEIGCWWKRSPNNSDFPVYHSGICEHGIVNEERTNGGEWGGSDTVENYVRLIKKAKARNTKMCFSNWDDARTNKPFAKNQIEALKQEGLV